MSNPDYIGEFQAFYYQIGDYDHDTATPPPLDDAAILADSNWLDLCVVSVDISNTFAEHVFNDTCSPDIESVAPGRRQVSITTEVNKLRWSDAQLKAWHGAVDGRGIVAVMALTADRTSTPTYGWIGNFIVTQADETNPQEGPMTESYTFRPSARTAYSPVIRRIYSSDIPAATAMVAAPVPPIIDEV